jgi:hypothetical protein
VPDAKGGIDKTVRAMYEPLHAAAQETALQEMGLDRSARKAPGNLADRCQITCD